ncbi:MAG: tetratricopeptide repeat protein [Bacteroidales bacterium]|nr:tetratricopeptide repeat protein [Bacteroidales bacterium]
MSNNTDQQAEKNLENIEATLTKTEQFVENNQKPIMLGALAIFAVVAIIWLVNSLYIQPRKADAQKKIFDAQYYFEADSFKLALNGDGQSLGFLDIIDEYGSTPAGELANYYAGVCYMKLGEFENAKNYLKSFSSDDETLNTFAIGLIGDAESELGNAAAAISAYEKAANKGNKIASPIYLMKLGAAYETQGNAEKAKKAYQQVKDEYATSTQAQLAEKYINSIK